MIEPLPTETEPPGYAAAGTSDVTPSRPDGPPATVPESQPGSPDATPPAVEPIVVIRGDVVSQHDAGGTDATQPDMARDGVEQDANVQNSDGKDENAPADAASTTYTTDNGADYRLTTNLTSAAITACQGRYFMLHAAGVADSDGRVAALIAASGTGKTTAIRHFCSLADYGYVTDETLIFNTRGEILPYPKPLSILTPTPDENGVIEKEQHNPSDLGLSEPPAGPLRLGPMVILDRLREESESLADEPPTLTHLDLVDALAALLPQSSSMPSTPNCLDEVARLASVHGGFRSLRYREIRDANDLLAQAFATPGEVEPWQHYPGNWNDRRPDLSPYGWQTPTGKTLPPAMADTEFRRGPFVDALSIHDETKLLLLVGNSVIVLQDLSATIWVSTQEATRLDELVARCQELYGEHPQAEELVRQCIAQLYELDLLEIVRLTE